MQGHGVALIVLTVLLSLFALWAARVENTLDVLKAKAGVTCNICRQESIDARKPRGK